MTSTLPEHLYGGLGDLRQKYPGYTSMQSLVLQRTYPAEFSHRHSSAAPSYRPGPAFNLNFDAAIVILRHLNSMTGKNERHNDTIAKEELAHPILRFIWADLENPSDEVNIRAQTILRYEMQNIDDPQGNLTVFDLLERPAMWNTLWARHPFRLFSPKILAQSPGSEWQIIPERSDAVMEVLRNHLILTKQEGQNPEPRKKDGPQKDHHILNIVIYFNPQKLNTQLNTTFT